MLFDLVQIIESIGFAKMLTGSNRRLRSKVVQISSQLITKLQPRRTQGQNS